MTCLDFGVMFLLGLASSLHCVQMCGPIVLAYSVALDSPAGEPRQWLPLVRNHLAYHAGRAVTYSGLGALAGLAGAMLGLVGRLAGASHILAIVTGALLILFGISLFGLVSVGKLQTKLLRTPTSILRRAARLFSKPGAENRLLLGVAMGFLPCGLIYAALVKAMSFGSALGGAISMLAFALGTSGALLAVGICSSAIRVRMNRWGSQLAAVGVTLMGLVLVWRGTMPGMMMGAHVHAHH